MHVPFEEWEQILYIVPLLHLPRCDFFASYTEFKSISPNKFALVAVPTFDLEIAIVVIVMFPHLSDFIAANY